MDNTTPKRQTTRKKLLAKSIQETRERVIKQEFQIKTMENALTRLTDDEIITIFPDGKQELENYIKDLKVFHTLEIIRLETLKAMRDGEPNINTAENRALVENAPKIRVEKK